MPGHEEWETATVDVATLNAVPPDRAELRINEVGEVTLQTRAPLVLDNHERIPTMGRFVLADENGLVGGGIISGAIYTSAKAVKSENIFWSESAIRNQHRGAVVWLTGLSGAGKSTIARALEKVMSSPATCSIMACTPRCGTTPCI